MKNLDLNEVAKLAQNMDLGELADDVLYGEFIPGIHDAILLKRCQAISKALSSKDELYEGEAC